MGSTFSPGAKFGRYTILSQLGVGGMGEVYLAYDTKLDRKAAIRRVDEDGESDSSLLEITP